MLGLVLIYFLGKAFYDLAKEHGRSAWGTAIGGVVLYYGTQFLFGVVLALVIGFDAVERIGNFGISILGIAIGALAAYILYQYLKSKWEREPITRDYELLDDDLTL